jgi:hypothetical protein
VVSVNYDVPRNHCFKCYCTNKPERSRDHLARDCTNQSCDVCHEHHETEICGYTKERAQVRHKYETVTDKDRQNRARARSAAMSQAGSQMGSQVEDSQADPTETHMRVARVREWQQSQQPQAETHHQGQTKPTSRTLRGPRRNEEWGTPANQAESRLGRTRRVQPGSLLPWAPAITGEGPARGDQ